MSFFCYSTGTTEADNIEQITQKSSLMESVSPGSVTAWPGLWSSEQIPQISQQSLQPCTWMLAWMPLASFKNSNLWWSRCISLCQTRKTVEHEMLNLKART